MGPAEDAGGHVGPAEDAGGMWGLLRMLEAYGAC